MYKSKKCFVDKGNKVAKDTKVFISATRKKRLKRRAAIEETISQIKPDGLLARSYLKGNKGNEINAILCGAGYNIRIIPKKLRLFLVLCFLICIVRKSCSGLIKLDTLLRDNYY